MRRVRRDRLAYTLDGVRLRTPSQRVASTMMADTASTTPQRARTRRELARTGALVVLAVLITLFAVLNVKEVEVNWIFGSIKTPLIVVIVVSLLVGILLTHFGELLARRRR